MRASTCIGYNRFLSGDKMCFAFRLVDNRGTLHTIIGIHFYWTIKKSEYFLGNNNVFRYFIAVIETINKYFNIPASISPSLIIAIISNHHCIICGAHKVAAQNKVTPWSSSHQKGCCSGADTFNVEYSARET